VQAKSDVRAMFDGTCRDVVLMQLNDCELGLTMHDWEWDMWL
jgi:hypothetical protein